MAGRRAANPESKDIPILAITALFGWSDLQTCIDTGCNDYIAKPFTPDRLLKKIMALIIKVRDLTDSNFKLGYIFPSGRRFFVDFFPMKRAEGAIPETLVHHFTDGVQVRPCLRIRWSRGSLDQPSLLRRPKAPLMRSQNCRAESWFACKSFYVTAGQNRWSRMPAKPPRRFGIFVRAGT